MTPVRLVVLACGNEARGDDALGPAFVAQAEAMHPPPGIALAFVADFQLQPEHALDLAGKDLALFVDADVDVPQGGRFRELAPAASPALTTHGMSPAAVLDAWRRAFGTAPPPAFELALHAERFELGAPMSTSARAGLRTGLAVFAKLCARATLPAWRALAVSGRIGGATRGTAERIA